jgi:hypothetical protein
MADSDEAVAREMVARLSRADFAGVRQAFDDPMRIAISEEKLRDVWQQATLMYGDFDRVGEPVAGKARGASLYDFPIVFSRGTAHQQVVVKEGKVAGAVLRPGRPSGRWEGNVLAWLLGRLRAIVLRD